MKKLFKAISLLLIGFIVPIHAIVEPGEETYRCSLRGVTSNTGHFESWTETFDGLKKYVKGVSL